MRRDTQIPVSGALAELLAKDGTLDALLEGKGLTFDQAPVEPAPEPGPPFRPVPVDWDRELAERAEAERKHAQQQRDAIIAEELARLEDEESYPAQPARKRRRLRDLFDRETP